MCVCAYSNFVKSNLDKSKYSSMLLLSIGSSAHSPCCVWEWNFLSVASFCNWRVVLAHHDVWEFCIAPSRKSNHISNTKVFQIRNYFKYEIISNTKLFQIRDSFINFFLCAYLGVYMLKCKNNHAITKEMLCVAY